MARRCDLDPVVGIDPGKAENHEHLLKHPREWSASFMPFRGGNGDTFLVETLNILPLAFAPGIPAFELTEDLQARFQ